MRFPTLSHLSRYVLAISLVVFTAAAFFTARGILDTPLIALLFLLPVGLSTARWGLGPGIASAICASLAFNYFFIQPYYTMSVDRPNDVFVLLAFLIVAVVISQFVGRAQAGEAAARAREREATQLYELSTALAGVHAEKTIVRILTEQVQTMCQPERVELSLSGEHPFSFHMPAGTSPYSRQPELRIPIQTARGVLGEIQLWRSTPALSVEEQRTLRAFASQGALALERALLVQAESRARVLEESDRLKSAILSSVSHELRTPLSTIKASVTSLHSGEVGWDTPARAELLAAIEDEADHLNLLVGNLLDMSRLEAGVLKPHRQWNVLSEIVGSVLIRLRCLADDHRIEIDVSDDLPLAPVDYVQMEQVFANLLSNSFKYAPASSVVRVQARVLNASTLLVQVINQGPQIPEEHLGKIFDKFYRVTAPDRVSGIGLGLSICKGIIEAHGGRIWAENLPAGIAFNFTLPLTLDGTPAPHLPIEAETE